MNKKVKRILAIIALGFMSVFTVTLVIWFAAPKWLNGQLGYWALFTGAVGIGLFFLIKFLKTPEEKAEEAKKLEEQYLPQSAEKPEEKPEEKSEEIAGAVSSDKVGEKSAVISSDKAGENSAVVSKDKDKSAVSGAKNATNKKTP